MTTTIMEASSFTVIFQYVSYIVNTFLWISLTCCIITSINIALLLREKYKNYRKLSEQFGYPIPEVSNPFFGHIDEFALKENEFRWHKELGKILGFYYCDAPHIRVADLNLINEVFLKRSKLFNARTWSEFRLRPLAKSILLSKGDRWKKTRKILQPALAEYRVKPNDNTTIHDIQCGLDKLISHFRSLVKSDDDIGINAETKSEQENETKTNSEDNEGSQYFNKGFVAVEHLDSPTGLALDINVYEVMQVVTLDVIFRLGFNLDTIDVTKGKEEPTMKTVNILMAAPDQFMYKLALAIPITRIVIIPFMLFFDYRLKVYTKFINSIVDFDRFPKFASNRTTTKPTTIEATEEKQKAQPKRIYSVLLQHYQAGELDRSEVLSNAMAILIAGFETTATTSSYVLWCIGKYDHYKERLRTDILNYGVESNYLSMFIKEAMRMYPALPNFVIRTPHEDTNIGGYKLKRGMSVHLSVNAIHHDESIWLNPYHFDPERFAKGRTYPPGAYAPFGLGHRMCAGYQLALREIKTIVCEVLTNFDIQLIAPNEMVTKSSSIFLTRPKNEIRMRLIPIRAGRTSNSNSNLNPNSKSIMGQRQSIQARSKDGHLLAAFEHQC